MKRLKDIDDWPRRAREAGWRVKTLAQNCGTSPRLLERHFQRVFEMTPHDWMMTEWNKQAKAMLLAGTQVEVTARKLGYKYPQHFARRFKKLNGWCPCVWVAQAASRWKL